MSDRVPWKTGQDYQFCFMVFDLDGVTPKTGLVDGDFTKQLALDGAFSVVVAPVVSEVSAGSFAGLYSCAYVPPVDGNFFVRLSNTDYLPRGVVNEVQSYAATFEALVSGTGEVTDATPGASTFITSLNLSYSDDDHWTNSMLVFRTGTLKGEARRVSAYSGTNGAITLATAFSAAPATNDLFDLVPADSANANLDVAVSSRAAAADWTTTRAEALDALVPATSTVNDGSPTAGSFETDLTEATGFWNGDVVEFRTGGLTGQSRPIASYVQANGTITLATDFTAPPGNGDEFVLLPSVSLGNLANLDAPISSRLSSTDSRLNDLDASISSRAATADSRLANLDATVSSRLASADSRLDDLSNLDAAVSSRAATGDAMTLAALSVDAGQITQAAANKLADFTWRRSYANIRASATGADAVSWRSPLGLLALSVNRRKSQAGQLLVYHEDDSTLIETLNLVSTTDAPPITEVAPT